MKDFWDERYGSKEYAYGIRPNNFFKTQIAGLSPGSILFPAEGEGRNAVYAATLGWEVTAYDTSAEGMKKAMDFASYKGVDINYALAGHDNFNAAQESYDCIVLIYAHSAPGQREAIHKKLTGFLRPGGTLIFEGFSKHQIYYGSGGPGNIGMLFSLEEIKADFQELSSLDISERLITLDEGKFHRGQAAVIRLVGIK